MARSEEERGADPAAGEEFRRPDGVDAAGVQADSTGNPSRVGRGQD